jgi:hypothetical protein
MGKRILFVMILPVLIVCLAGVSNAWQGRMGGMGDPYGLIQDESDYLIHPAKIVTGKGVTFYGDYRFTYTRVPEWDQKLTFLIGGSLPFSSSGEEYMHNVLVGAAFPVGRGRMGLFFSYDGIRGDFDGEGRPGRAELTHDLDNFALRLLYGLPVLGMNAGVEMGVAYRDEEQKWWIPFTKNDVFPTDYDQNLHFLMNPYNSKYWELSWKAGVGKKFNTASLDWTIRGGYFISSDNKYEYQYGIIGSEHVVMDGDVTGFRIGTDLWFRYQMSDSLSLPFVVSMDYTSRHRDGDGIGTGIGDLGSQYTYAHKETALDAKVGGGLEKKIGTNGLVSGALYYHYLQGHEHQWFGMLGLYLFDFRDFPSHQAHRLEVRLAGEWQLMPTVALRLGLNPFYGWIPVHDFKQVASAVVTDDINTNGHEWGISASLGATLKFSRLQFEPFIKGGYYNVSLSGDGTRTPFGAWWKLDQERSTWFAGGGLSVLFGL